MPKRKRSEATASISPEPAAARFFQRRRNEALQRISAVQKPLVAALRHATGLERQKHSRRKKTAQSSKDTKGVARLDAEYALLKSMNLEKLAEQHIRKTIGKVKSLRESEVLPEAVKQAEKAEKNPALLNVQARLFKVDAVRKVVDEIIDDLKEIVGAAAVGPKADHAKKAKVVEEQSPDPNEDADEDSEAFAAFDARIAAPSSGEGESEDSLSDGQRPPSEEDIKSEDLDELDEEDSAEEGDLPFHSFDDESDMESKPSSDAESMPPPKSKRKSAEAAPITSSSFLPTLSHAAFVSGSESEASDVDMDVAPRKNRRGQRARQKIWEQKFKDNAKHLQKEDKNQGWDPKRGAVDTTRGRNGARGSRKAPPRGRGPEQSGANEIPLGQKKMKRDDAGALHPSWLAAKAAKEKKIDVKPQGKKVVFD